MLILYDQVIYVMVKMNTVVVLKNIMELVVKVDLVVYVIIFGMV